MNDKKIEILDRAENLAYQYLINNGFNPIYEPNGGSTFPDCEIEGNISVEVRRLNENNFTKFNERR